MYYIIKGISEKSRGKPELGKSRNRGHDRLAGCTLYADGRLKPSTFPSLLLFPSLLPSTRPKSPDILPQGIRDETCKKNTIVHVRSLLPNPSHLIIKNVNRAVVRIVVKGPCESAIVRIVMEAKECKREVPVPLDSITCVLLMRERKWPASNSL
jgi:hypothetical protein